jgi:hypothetical protein
MRSRLGIVTLSVVTSACGSVALNATCEWPARGSTELSLREHVQLAEDVAIRFADARGESPQWRANRETYEALLFDRIASDRGVSLVTVLEARQQLAERPFDWSVNLPMAVLTVALGFAWGRWVTGRFAVDERTVAALAVAVGAVAIAFTVVAVGQIWAGVIETWRIGNGHLSYRAFRIPWQHHRTVTFTLAAFAVVLVSATELRRRRSGARSW